MTVVCSISGGTGSWAAAWRYAQHNDISKVRFMFADTMMEDQDAYRFLLKGVAVLVGRHIDVPEIGDFPAWEDRNAYKVFVTGLRSDAACNLPELAWLADGRDVWDVFEDVAYLGNARADPCSRVLKRQLMDRWLRETYPDGGTQIVGIDYEEDHRLGPIQAVKAQQGWNVLAPLCDSPLWDRQVIAIEMAKAGLWVPRLNRLGFAHNNCGGFCCKAGHGQFALMLKVFPERYDYAEWREQRLRERLGGRVSILRDRRGGVTRPMTLTTLRARVADGYTPSDMGGCGCAFGDSK